MDNDVYGHVNNAVYYSYFDSVANHYLIHEGGLDIERGEVIGLVVESHCNYHAPVAYPRRLRAGLRIDRLGARSITYGLAVFPEDESEAVAHGYNVHVFVDRARAARRCRFLNLCARRLNSSALAECSGLAAAAVLLHRRARHGAVRTVYAAVAWLGAQHFAALRTFVEELAGVDRHGFFPAHPAVRTGQGRLQDGAAHLSVDAYHKGWFLHHRTCCR